MLAHYRTALTALTATPARRLSEIDILSEVERQRIAAWSEATAADSSL